MLRHARTSISKRALAILAILALSTVTACGSGTPNKTSETQAGSHTDTSTDTSTVTFNRDNLIEEAEQEGKFVWYTGLGNSQAADILAAFHKKYPSIDVSEFYASDAAGLSSRILAEASSGKAIGDVLSTGDPTVFITLKQKELLAEFSSPSMDAYPAQYKNPGYWTAFHVMPLIMAYNPEAVSEADVPKAWADLTNPKYEGKLSFQSSGSGAMHTEWYLLKELLGDDYWPSVAKNKPVFVTLQQVTQGVLNGSRPIAGEIPSFMVAVNGLQPKAPMAPIWPSDGVPVALAFMGVLDQAAHPAAARLFADWALSAEGQTAMVSTVLDYSGRPDVKGPDLLPPSLDKFKLLTVTDLDDFSKTDQAFTQEWKSYGAS